MKTPLTVCICGGGALAHVFAGVLGANPDVSVRVLTRQPKRWQRVMRVLYREEAELHGVIEKVSHEPAAVVPDADLVLLPLPANVRSIVIEQIRPYLSDCAWVGAVPGWGGFDWQARQLLGASSRIFGLARTPFICRIEKYGESVLLSGIQDRLQLAGFPKARIGEAARLLEIALGIPVEVVPNYLVVTMAPSNAIVHPSRLYSLFYQWTTGTIYTRQPLFYAEWDERASDMLLGCDNELQLICSALPLDLSQVVSIKQHYRLSERRTLTGVIRSIHPLAQIASPYVQKTGGFVPDQEHRFFTEDIPYGLVVLRGIAEIVGVATPTIDHILRWSQLLLNRSFLKGNSLDLVACSDLPLPQNFGICTSAGLVENSGSQLS